MQFHKNDKIENRFYCALELGIGQVIHKSALWDMTNWIRPRHKLICILYHDIMI